jgi:hypothetical protein
MAYHGVLIPEAIAATNIDSYNRSAYSASASSIDNGMVFTLSGKVWTSGSGAEVYNVVTPATGSLTGLWMAYSGDEVVLTSLKYKGLDPNPRNFYNEAGKVFSAYKPQVGDIILLTAEALTGTQSTNEYVVAANGAMQLTWSATPVATLTYKLLGTSYISIGTGAIDTQRVTAYEFECIIA